MSAPQISDSELELMKIIWSAGGAALYAQIMEALAEEIKQNAAQTRAFFGG